jgi:phosphoserine phosphatase RsbU/P
MEVSDTVVKQEFDRSTDKLHVITTWVGLALNLLWVISDYIVLPQHLAAFAAFRISVSGLSIFMLLFRKQLKFTIYDCMFYLVLGISLQNAYMWSVMDVDHFQQHAFAYMVLFIGVGMLVLWEIKHSVLILIFNVAANIVFYSLNSSLSVREFMINGGLITLTVLIFCIFLIRSRYRLIYNDIRIRMQLEQSKKMIQQQHDEVLVQKKEVQEQKEKVEEQNREITDSIRYASNIQRALLTGEEKFISSFRDAFVFFQPRDIVSGDFYWITEKDDFIFYITADCTGHGVPGGFMTMLGLSYFDEIIMRGKTNDPAAMLDMMREKIMSTLKQTGTFGENKDGMDVTICRISKKNRELVYASANNDFLVVRHEGENKELIPCKADRQPCGYYHLNLPFTSHTVALKQGDCIYTFTDGYQDQFGGPRGKKFRYSQLQDILKHNSHLTMDEQKKILSGTINEWKNSTYQVDDILVIGVRI